VPEAEQRRITRDNVIDLYHLDLAGA